MPAEITFLDDENDSDSISFIVESNQLVEELINLFVTADCEEDYEILLCEVSNVYEELDDVLTELSSMIDVVGERLDDMLEKEYVKLTMV